MTASNSNQSSENIISYPCDAIELIIKPKEKDLGEFSVRRALPVAAQPMVGPWIFVVHMGPATFSAGQGVNVRPHPHINLATVTYLFEGEILHRDSLGSVQPIKPGDINLMVAGHGIVHSERERPEVRNAEHKLHGLQLWLALPEADEESDPAFHHYPGSEIPKIEVDGVAVRVMMGEAYGVISPVKTHGRTLYAEARMGSGQVLEVPMEAERAIYLTEGSARIDGVDIAVQEMAVLKAGCQVRVEALADTQLAIIGGENPGKRFINWNFVSSRKGRIESARRMWHEGEFPTVPGDEVEFIPLPD
jgi:redox-sensitive bicupin YhaK (pirin superfamily)